MNPATPQRVAVTGLGALSPGGVGLARYRAWLASPGAETRVPGFDPADYVGNPKLLRSMQRTFQLVAAASVLAMRAAALPSGASLLASGIHPERAGIACALSDLSPLTRDLLEVLAQTSPPDATGAIDWGAFSEIALHHLHPFRRLTLLANMAVAHTSLLFGLQGPSFTFTSGATAGLQAIAQAFWTVAEGHSDLMLCPTAESPEQTFTASPPPETAGALLLESWDLAQRRGAPILAELVAESDPAGMAASPGKTPIQGGRATPATAFLAALVRIDADAGEDARIGLPALATAQYAALGEPS